MQWLRPQPRELPPRQGQPRRFDTISTPSQRSASDSEQARHEWQRRPALSLLIRVAVIAAPALAGVAAAVGLSRLLPHPTDVPHGLLWFAADTAAMVLAVLAVERVARRLLPLAALLNLSLLFPDQAPKRFAVARRVGRPRDLQRQLQEARDKGVVGGETAYMQTVLELVAALSVHDRQTRGHSERVRVLADLIADEMKLPQADRARLRWASLLHDIGKLLIDGDILRKPAALSSDEWEHIRRHPDEGARMIGPLRSWLGQWAAAVEHHHERWDGKGYPRALQGEEISLAGRIVAVADSYEVMTAVRTYRRPIGVTAARQELVRCSGKQFDPVVVRAFLNISVGRLWRVVGLGTWIAQFPFISWVNGLRLGWGTAIISGSTALGLTAPGVLATPGAVLEPRAGPPAVSVDSGPTHRSAPPGSQPPAVAPSNSQPVLSRVTVTPRPTQPPANGGSPAGSAGPNQGSGSTPGPGPTPTPGPSPPPPPPITNPTVTMPAPKTMYESTYMAAGSFADPGGSGWTASVNYGDGSTAVPLGLSGSSFTLQHPYAAACTCTVTVTITNARGGFGTGTTTVTVKPDALSVQVNPGGAALLGAFHGGGSFSDADPYATSFSGTVNYGDGSAPQTLTVTGRSFALSHNYGGLLGQHTVTVTITDNLGTVAQGTTTVTVLL